MGRKNRAVRIIPEQDRRICAGICVCQLTAVLSCVALVYLSVAVYIPAKKTLEAGLEPIPAVCQTVETKMAANCSWSSCGEWCLTKSSSPCPQINVTVRNNGSNIRLENCNRAASVACPPADEESLRRYNCNMDGECETITGVFTCKRGHCANLSEIYNCRPVADGNIIDAEKDNLKLNGFFECQRSRCRQIRKWPFPCDRYCPRVTTSGVNVLLLHGDNLVAAECARAVRLNSTSPGVMSENATIEVADDTMEDEPVVWTPDKGVLMATCLKAERNPALAIITAEDCINGTTVPESRLPSHYMNFTFLWALFEEAQAMRKDSMLPPPQNELVIYKSSKLLINLEGCVNTLRGECNEFVKTHGRDGTNHTGESRFQCFYHKRNAEIVVARHDLERTRLELMFAAGLPGVLLILSCCSLIACTRTVRVGDDAKMRCHLRRCCCCCPGDTGETNTNKSDDGLGLD